VLFFIQLRVYSGCKVLRQLQGVSSVAMSPDDSSGGWSFYRPLIATVADTQADNAFRMNHCAPRGTI